MSLIEGLQVLEGLCPPCISARCSGVHDWLSFRSRAMRISLKAGSASCMVTSPCSSRPSDISQEPIMVACTTMFSKPVRVMMMCSWGSPRS